ncbi:MAG: MotA/TolQ/ExbB proton channel family protein [Granulosicoccus sp.]
MSTARKPDSALAAIDKIAPLGADSSEFYPQLWLLLVSLIVFGAFVAWDLHVFALVLSLDKSYMASLTMALVVVMSVHCGWHVVHTARHTLSAQRWLDDKEQQPVNYSPFLQRFLTDLSTDQPDGGEDVDDIIEIHADAVRSPAELGWFFVDLAVRLGLLGTIIGFILIFASLDKIDIEGGDDLKNLLIAMSGGMGTALYTTLTGLVGASLLSFQYLVLGRQSEHLIAQLLRIRRRLRNDVALKPA